MKKIFFLCSLMMTTLWILGISGCAQPPRPPHVLLPASSYDRPSPSTKAVPLGFRIPVSEFDKIIVTGPVSMTVNNHQLETQLIAHSTREGLKNLSVHTRQGVLYISASRPIFLTLNLAQPVHQFIYKANGQLDFQSTGNQSLQLILGGNSTTRMTGDLVLSRIVLSDNAVLHAYWINSSNLHVITKDHAKLFLAGIVTHLDIIAAGDSDVDAKYLRAEIAYVRTSDDADVGVRVRRSLSSFSTDRSTVYYYRDSYVEMHYLAHHGSALRMKGIP